MTPRDPSIPWRETRIGALTIAVLLIAVGVALSVGAFALSSVLGAATTVVAIAPFVVAVRLVARAFRGRLWVLGVFLAGAVVVVWIGALMAPYMDHWDPTGEAVEIHAPPLPANAIGRFALPEGDPGISGIYAAFVGEGHTFDRSNGYDQLYLAFVQGRATNDGYVATEVAVIEPRSRMPWDGTSYQRVVGHCSGTATFEDGGWTLAFTDARCRRASGRYPHQAPPDL